MWRDIRDWFNLLAAIAVSVAGVWLFFFRMNEPDFSRWDMWLIRFACFQSLLTVGANWTKPKEGAREG